MNIFQNATELAQARLASGQFVETLGLTNPGDTGAARYYIEPSSYLALSEDITLANGNHARRVFVFSSLGGVNSTDGIDNDSNVAGTTASDALNTLDAKSFDAADIAYTAGNIPTVSNASDALDVAYQASLDWIGIEGADTAKDKSFVAASFDDARWMQLFMKTLGSVELLEVNLQNMLSNISVTRLGDVTQVGDGKLPTASERANWVQAFNKILVSGALTASNNTLTITLNDAAVINIDVSALNQQGQTAKHLGVYADATALNASHPTAVDGSTATVTSPDGNLFRYDSVAGWEDTGTGFLGDMLKAAYDPTNVDGDAFDMDNMVNGSVNVAMLLTERAKLTGIETGATADQTGAEIKAAYEGEADTNAFTDAYKTKLDTLDAPTMVTKAFGDSPYSASWGEDIEVDCSGGDVTINLPTAVGNTGKNIYVTKTDSSAYKIIIDGSTTETINGQTTRDVTQQYDSLLLRSDGTNVRIR